MRRCIFTSLEGPRSPWEITVPSSRIFTIMSSDMKPLLTPVGVVQKISSSTLTEMFPSLAATKFLSYMRRPISTIILFASSSVGYLLSTIFPAPFPDSRRILFRSSSK